jgi:hypothetical protein
LVRALASEEEHGNLNANAFLSYFAEAAKMYARIDTADYTRGLHAYHGGFPLVMASPSVARRIYT